MSNVTCTPSTTFFFSITEAYKNIVSCNIDFSFEKKNIDIRNNNIAIPRVSIKISRFLILVQYSIEHKGSNR